jgi:hypothetical protein
VDQFKKTQNVSLGQLARIHPKTASKSGERALEYLIPPFCFVPALVLNASRVQDFACAALDHDQGP